MKRLPASCPRRFPPRSQPESAAPTPAARARSGRTREIVVARGWAGPVIWSIKLLHTAIFTVMSFLVLYTTYSGIRNRITRLTVIAWLAVLGECLVLLFNHNRCPLTDVVEDLGAEHGSVSDIFLPDWAARRIPHCMWLVVAGGVALAWHRLRTRSPRRPSPVSLPV